MENAPLKLGEYRHYKGKSYRVLGVAKNSETKEDVVVYEALSPNDVSMMWVRPLEMFQDKVVVNSMKIPRFRYVGP